VKELWKLSARQAVGLLKRKKVSPLELIDAAEARIAATNPKINAFVTLCLERARTHARRLMKQKAAGRRPAHYLHGLPIGVKDGTDVEGVRTTSGSRIYAERIAPASDIVVERLEANGAIVIGKTNLPEFAAGGNTFNDVFGATRNPWDTTKSASGSSGGTAAALASGQVWLATGGDFGGSIRTPSSFNSITGLRPSPGMVPRASKQPFNPLSVEGPMARDVADTALMFDCEAGWHPLDPMSQVGPHPSFSAAAARPAKPRRLAFSTDLGVARAGAREGRHFRGIVDDEGRLDQFLFHGVLEERQLQSADAVRRPVGNAEAREPRDEGRAIGEHFIGDRGVMLRDRLGDRVDRPRVHPAAIPDGDPRPRGSGAPPARGQGSRARRGRCASLRFRAHASRCPPHRRPRARRLGGRGGTDHESDAEDDHAHSDRGRAVALDGHREGREGKAAAREDAAPDPHRDRGGRLLEGDGDDALHRSQFRDVDRLQRRPHRGHHLAGAVGRREADLPGGRLRRPEDDAPACARHGAAEDVALRSQLVRSKRSSSFSSTFVVEFQCVSYHLHGSSRADKERVTHSTRPLYPWLLECSNVDWDVGFLHRFRRDVKITILISLALKGEILFSPCLNYCIYSLFHS